MADARDVVAVALERRADALERQPAADDQVRRAGASYPSTVTNRRARRSISARAHAVRLAAGQRTLADAGTSTRSPNACSSIAGPVRPPVISAWIASAPASSSIAVACRGVVAADRHRGALVREVGAQLRRRAGRCPGPA